ncbi:MAG TPA: hypothetical protein VFW90_01110 [Candidatus Saccharimonadales bacterium]|nr:hypothetical protein [Candidatus Saccharimonadales bacterium]
MAVGPEHYSDPPQVAEMMNLFVGNHIFVSIEKVDGTTRTLVLHKSVAQEAGLLVDGEVVIDGLSQEEMQSVVDTSIDPTQN